MQSVVTDGEAAERRSAVRAKSGRFLRKSVSKNTKTESGISAFEIAAQSLQPVTAFFVMSEHRAQA